MESLERTNFFISKIFQVFTPPMVKLEVTYKDPTGKTVTDRRCFTTDKPEGKNKLFSYIWRNHPTSLRVKKVTVTTSPGTIRVHSKDYKGREPYCSMSYMGLEIDILRCHPEPTEVQQVGISQDKLERNGSNIPTPNIDLLKEKWNDNPNCHRLPMPYPISNYIRRKSKKHSVQDREGLRRVFKLVSPPGGPR